MAENPISSHEWTHRNRMLRGNMIEKLYLPSKYADVDFTIDSGDGNGVSHILTHKKIYMYVLRLKRIDKQKWFKWKEQTNRYVSQYCAFST